MTTAPRHPGVPHAGPDGLPVRIPLELRVAAAARLMGDSGGVESVAGRRMVAAAASQGIDLSLMWGTLQRDERGVPVDVREAALLVPGTGKTAMLLFSHPRACAGAAEEAERAERVACGRAACAWAARRDRPGPTIRLVQALPDAQELWAVRALTETGFRKVGDLAYLRRDAAGLEKWATLTPQWPEGVVVRNVLGAARGEPDREALIAALERSYISTLDCPELCGLRETGDVLDSHRATGQFDPKLWWLVLWRGEPHGCLLLSHSPELGSAELVYLGLSPELRGKGIATPLLRMGLGRVSRLRIDHVACAVDLRNTPAMKLYERLGFLSTSHRVAMVRPVESETRNS